MECNLFSHNVSVALQATVEKLKILYYKIIIRYNFKQFYLKSLLQQITMIVLHLIALKLFIDYNNDNNKPPIDWNEHISTVRQVCVKKLLC